MEYWTALASLMGAFAFLQGVVQAMFPAELRAALARLLGRLTRAFSPYCYFDVTEMEGMSTNEIYDAVQLYLSSTAAPASGARLSLSRPLNASSFTFGLAASDRVVDTFAGCAVTWEHVVAPRQSQGFAWRPLPEEKRRFTLRIRRGDRDKLLPAYLDHILAAAADIRRRSQDRMLYTNARGGVMDTRGLPWDPVPFKHPSTFGTLAMDPARKAAIMADLRDFAGGSAFYERTGRAWKRGYLLYGPPGTGKSSMIAAMANFLGYDVYDLELTEVSSNAELRKLLMKTTSKSIIVIEDIDCSVDLTGKRKDKKAEKKADADSDDKPKLPTDPDKDDGTKVTLSGLLNFIDGLWSACGGERIIIFTTNHKDKLDPALIRRGRMDRHIEMSYCRFRAFKVLAKNYLDVEEHELFGQIAQLLEETDMSPADVAENLMPMSKKKKRDANACFEGLVEALKQAKEEAAAKALAEAAKAKEKAEAEAKEAKEKDKAAAEATENRGEDKGKDSKMSNGEIKEGDK